MKLFTGTKSIAEAELFAAIARFVYHYALDAGIGKPGAVLAFERTERGVRVHARGKAHDVDSAGVDTLLATLAAALQADVPLDARAKVLALLAETITDAGPSAAAHLAAELAHAPAPTPLGPSALYAALDAAFAQLRQAAKALRHRAQP